MNNLYEDIQLVESVLDSIKFRCRTLDEQSEKLEINPYINKDDFIKKLKFLIQNTDDLHRYLSKLEKLILEDQSINNETNSI